MLSRSISSRALRPAFAARHLSSAAKDVDVRRYFKPVEGELFLLPPLGYCQRD